MPADEDYPSDVLEPLPAVEDVVIVALPHHYQSDPLVRRARSLQARLSPFDRAVRMNLHTALHLGIHDNATKVSVYSSQGIETILPVIMDPAVADQVVILPRAFGLVSIRGVTCS